VIAFTVIGGLPEFNRTMLPTMSGIAPSFPLAAALAFVLVLWTRSPTI
jgi:hypothetical protein